ncbi:putative thiamine biosynthesis protein, partial [Haemophilus influenzae]
GGRKS